MKAGLARLAIIGTALLVLDPTRAAGQVGAWLMYTAVTAAVIVAVVLARLTAALSSPSLPDAPVLHGPPPGVSPVAGAYLLDGHHSEGRLLAMICDLSLRGVLKLQGTPDGWIAGKVDDDRSADISVAEQTVLRVLGLDAPGALFAFSSDKPSRDVSAVAQRTLDVWAEQEAGQYMVSDPIWWGALWVAGGAGVLTTFFLPDENGVFGPSNTDLFVTNSDGLFALVFTFLTAGIFVDQARSKRRSHRGLEIALALKGFRRGLRTDSAQARFANARKGGYLAPNLQWAIAFGLSPDWRVARVTPEDQLDAATMQEVWFRREADRLSSMGGAHGSVPPPT